jgi:hypothetical protein
MQSNKIVIAQQNINKAIDFKLHAFNFFFIDTVLAV